MTHRLNWTNPRRVDLSKGRAFLFIARVVDGVTKAPHYYVGKSTRGENGLDDYRRNVDRIFAGRPRRTTPGQEKFRAVHLALAKACEFGWEYEFFPTENVEHSCLNEVRSLRISGLGCDLNAASSWSVEDYETLSITDLL